MNDYPDIRDTLNIRDIAVALGFAAIAGALTLAVIGIAFIVMVMVVLT